MRDVNNGWLIRYLHSNTASAFFFLVYLHIGRNLYYGSYRTPRTLVWIIGIVIFILMIVTAFLGYQHSPKWFLLNLYYLLNIFFSNTTLYYYISYLFLLLFITILTLFYLDRFRLSSVYFIKCFQIFTIIGVLLILIISIYNSISITQVMCHINNNNGVNIHGHVNLDKEAGIAIGQSLNVIGSQIGLGATITVVYLAVAKGISKASMPPLQKAGIILGTGLIVGLGHSRISVINKKIISPFALISSQHNHQNVFKQNFKRYNSRTSGLLNDFLLEKELKPTFIYEDLHLDDTRNKILKDTKNLSGVYLIFNKITGDYYVGSASTNRFHARLTNHLIYFKGSKILKYAVRKYKLSNFIFLILEIFPEVVTKENNKKLLDLEDFYLKSLLPNYNILTEAGSSFGYKHTELDRIKMKANYSASRRDLIGNLNKNKPISLEIKEKMRLKALIREKRSFTVEGLLNMKKKSKPIILYNLNKTVFGEYPSIVETARKINCSEKTIIRALKTDKRILKKRFIVEYKKM